MRRGRRSSGITSIWSRFLFYREATFRYFHALVLAGDVEGGGLKEPTKLAIHGVFDGEREEEMSKRDRTLYQGVDVCEASGYAVSAVLLRDEAGAGAGGSGSFV